MSVRSENSSILTTTETFYTMLAAPDEVSLNSTDRLVIKLIRTNLGSTATTTNVFIRGGTIAGYLFPVPAPTPFTYIPYTGATSNIDHANNNFN